MPSPENNAYYLVVGGPESRARPEPKMTDAEQVTQPELDTRQALLRAAAEVFAERGYEGTGVQEIARRAGLTTGAIYGNFRGKADLLLEVVRNISDPAAQLQEIFDRYPDADTQIVDRLRMGASRMLDAERRQMRELQLEALVAARREPEVGAVVRDYLEKQRTPTRRAVEVGQQAGSLTTAVDADTVAQFGQILNLGLALLEAAGAPLPDKRRWEALMNRLLSLLEADRDETPKKR